MKCNFHNHTNGCQANSKNQHAGFVDFSTQCGNSWYGYESCTSYAASWYNVMFLYSAFHMVSMIK